MGSKIGTMKINLYKSAVILKSNYHVFSRNTARGQGYKIGMIKINSCKFIVILELHYIIAPGLYWMVICSKYWAILIILVIP